MKTTTSPFGKKRVTHDNLFNIQGNFVNIVVVNGPIWLIPSTAVDELVAERAIYEPLYLKSQNKNTRTRADVAAHKLAAERYLKILRRFWNKWIEDGDMPTEGKLLLGGDLLDTEPSPGSPITDVPIVGLKGLGGGDIEVRCRVTTDQTRASMHPDANVVDYRYIMVASGTVPPADPEDCPKGDSQPKAKFVLRAGAKNSGKRFYGFFRWLNNRRPRQEGPWSDAQSVVIA